MTGTPSRSAWNCMSRSLPTMPPSTFSDSRSTPESWFIASTTSRLWYAVASSVAQPLHERPGDRDRALQAVDGVVVADLVADRGQQAVLRHDRLRARVEQQEVAGAVGVLRLADVEAGLPERRRLLVAEVAGD